ncbi:putative flippase GtrA [Clostridium beijerinckii]|uniref:GtrA family protein n=1 Tax=Clostridium beijerinckii TaxID=1520 RepID=UPI00149432D6|nr:GtrA family protein [Clostridium beijerinckii]NOW87144.1 putative flippase GtrA [Clostridium beijerinckii]
MEKINQITDIKIIKFLIVGGINTLIGVGVMLVFYNIFGFNYWISSVANYIVGSIISYLLNKYWTFKNKNKSFKIIIKFIINVLICYLLAYGIAKPFVKIALSGVRERVQENVAMLIGMILFTILNYFGQRFFAFKDND